MAYQLKRSNKVFETLELVNESGSVEHSLKIEIDADLIINDFRKCKNALVNSERKLKEAQKADNLDEMEELFGAYGNAVINILKLLLGDENTDVIIEFYEERYVELSMHIMPFIYNVIQPAVEKAVNEKKESLKNSFNRKQRRAMKFN